MPWYKGGLGGSGEGQLPPLLEIIISLNVLHERRRALKTAPLSAGPYRAYRPATVLASPCDDLIQLRLEGYPKTIVIDAIVTTGNDSLASKLICHFVRGENRTLHLLIRRRRS
ncbi:hypothetical protein EVAR_845_1 [Eumeta japonica]|uniref:Uncharacterized protein n=1 Tax=Eumeta variegata TaxID=151549 RepID=A0A4C1SGI9_EUMVA|nr:hypothetical protein EVAR_845_1 [Eumeta japonica]